MLLFVLIGVARAAEVDVGGAVDAAGVVTSTDAGVGTVTGLQAEGDLRLNAGALVVEAQIDALTTHRGGAANVFDLFPDHPPWLVALRPEVLVVGVDAGGVALDAGIAPAPWRVEAVDGWDNAMVTWNGLEGAVPGEVLGAHLRLGGGEGSVTIVGGMDGGVDGLRMERSFGGDRTDAQDAFHLGGGWAPVVGIHGSWTHDRSFVGGGVFAWPGGDGGALEAGGRAHLGTVALQGDAIVGWYGPVAFSAQAELFPDGLVAPAVRATYVDRALGGSLGVRVNATDHVAVKAEAGVAGGVPFGALEAAVFSGLPERR